MEQQLLHVGRKHQDGAAARSEFVQRRVNLGAGMDVDTLGRIAQQQDLGSSSEPFADNDLLLVAAAEPRDVLRNALRPDPQPRDHALGEPSQRVERKLPGPTLHRYAHAGQVVANALVHEQALTVPVVGDQADAAPDHVARYPCRHALATMQNAA